ncbi:shikimate dehydrogenase family protein [Maribacter sp. 2307ULW6-5]|uniref:shikimate dehydrogenase family protein n=1 Tax=Maribacter sp. 2307ULW6-5 TaxID=3386275 RepID=UPI0039BCC034
MQHRYGLIGKDIGYSFSPGYFKEKFAAMGLEDHHYDNFDLPRIADFPSLVAHQPNLRGLNVTIPYKEAILPYLDAVEGAARAIGAVNTIAFGNGQLTGHNTDAYGFATSLAPFLEKQPHKKALILGTGGASKAVAHVLAQWNIPFQYVSRSGKNNGLSYAALSTETIAEYTLIVNCSPVGTFPKITDKPDLPYGGITPRHLLYDLIYNPAKTAFLAEGEQRGAAISNGLEMLRQQAEKAWEIWTR